MDDSAEEGRVELDGGGGAEAEVAPDPHKGHQDHGPEQDEVDIHLDARAAREVLKETQLDFYHLIFFLRGDERGSES